MTPFRTSLSARIVSFAVAACLIGGGVIARFVDQPSHSVPLLLTLCVVASIVGLVFGLTEHPEAVILLFPALSMSLLVYVMVLQLMITSFRDGGYLLMALGAVPLVLTALAPRSVPKTSPRRAPESRDSSAHGAGFPTSSATA